MKLFFLISDTKSKMGLLYFILYHIGFFISMMKWRKFGVWGRRQIFTANFAKEKFSEIKRSVPTY